MHSALRALEFEFRGDRRVVTDLKNKAHNPEAHPLVINVLVQRGGGQTQAVGAGLSAHLYESGLIKGIDIGIGYSAGLANQWALLNGLEELNDTYYKSNIDNELINWTRNPIIDVVGLIKRMRQVPVDQDRFRKSRQRLVTGFTRWETGELVVVDFGDTGFRDLHTGLVGGKAFPVFSGNVSVLDPERTKGRLVDGAIADPQALHAAFGKNEVFSARLLATQGYTINFLFVLPDPPEYRHFETRNVAKPFRALAKAGIIPGVWATTASYPSRFNRDSSTLAAILAGEISFGPNIRVGAFTAKRSLLSPFCTDADWIESVQRSAKNSAQRILYPE